MEGFGRALAIFGSYLEKSFPCKRSKICFLSIKNKSFNYDGKPRKAPDCGQSHIVRRYDGSLVTDPTRQPYRCQDGWKWFLPASRSSPNPPGPREKANTHSFITRCFITKFQNIPWQSGIHPFKGLCYMRQVCVGFSEVCGADILEGICWVIEGCVGTAYGRLLEVIESTTINTGPPQRD